MTTQDKKGKEESYTYYVTRSPYNTNTSVPTDAVLYSFTSLDPSVIERLKTFPLETDRKEIIGGTCANQDVAGCYTGGGFDGQSHEEDIFTRADGSQWSYGLLKGIPYILPTENFNRYLSQMMRGMIENGAARVGLSEMGIWGEVGFEKAFRREWEAYYQEPWRPFWEDQDLYFKAQHLKNQLMNRQARMIFGSLKKAYPHIRFLIASHTSLAYYPFRNPVGNHDVMAADCVDGIEAQTWSNTLEIPFRYDGRVESRPFIAGYVDYSYWANLSRQFPEKEMYFVTDPKGDGYTGKTLDHCCKYYRHQLVTQLIFSNVYRYCSCEWPDRAYSEGYGQPPFTTPKYKIIMNNIISLQGQMYRFRGEVQTPNRPLRVGALLLDTSNYQAGGPGNTVDNDSFFGLVAGLMYHGLLADTIPVGSLKSNVDILDSYDLILVSYDLMKPANEHCSQMLKAYVENGGCVLFFNGKRDYEDLAHSWWRLGGWDSPCDHLMNLLGCGQSGRRPVKGDGLSLETGCGLAVTLGLPDTVPEELLGYDEVPGASPLLRCGNAVAAFEKTAGKGHFFFFGIDPAWFTEEKAGEYLFQIVWAIAEKRLRTAIAPRNDILYRRGPVMGYHAIGDHGDIPEGLYLDLFDPELSVITGMRVEKGESALLLDISRCGGLSIPTVLFVPGRDPLISESPEATRVETAGPTNSLGTIRLYVPQGLQFHDITAVGQADGRDELVSYSWHKPSSTLLIVYRNRVEGVALNIHYSESGE